MAHRLTITAIACVLLLGAGATGADDLAARSNLCQPAKQGCFQLVSTIAFASTRDNPTATGDALFNSGEIYLMNPDSANPDPRKVTNNTVADAFANLSPDGKKIVFDSNRNTAETEPVNTSDLFLMDADGGGQTFLTRGSSATWSPNGKNIAFHASASGHGALSRDDPGGAAIDSDIFVVNVDDLLAGQAEPRNLTNSADKIDDDADWSPDGQHIVYTAHDVGDDIPAGAGYLSNSAEIYVINADGSGRIQLTHNSEQETAPAWSPDGSQIVFSCRVGGGRSDFELCVINADGSGLVQLTESPVSELSATWAPDGTKIVFQSQNELWLINPDGTGRAPLTNTPGFNLFPHWGVLRVHVKQ